MIITEPYLRLFSSAWVQVIREKGNHDCSGGLICDKFHQGIS